jgi:hypothetical protein
MSRMFYQFTHIVLHLNVRNAVAVLCCVPPAPLEYLSQTRTSDHITGGYVVAFR